MGTFKEFEKELKELINKHSIENHSDTPDWIIANFIVNCLANWTSSTKEREKYYGRDCGSVKASRKFY